MKNTLQKNLIITIGFATIALASAANAQTTWENIVTAGGVGGSYPPANLNIPGVPADAVFVPNSFNNPLIAPNGNVVFRAQLAGTGIQATNPNNSHIELTGSSGSTLVQVARAGNALPSGLAPGLVCNSTTGVNGLASTQFESGNGGILITGNLNGTGVTTATSPFWMWRDPTGANNYILYRGADAYPGAAGVTMTASVGSPQYVNNDGAALVYATLAGTGVITTAGVTANNGAVVWMGPSGKTVLFRKGDACPGFTDGTVLQPDSYSIWVNGSNAAIYGTLFGGTVTTSDNAVELTNAWGNGLEVWGRKGGPIAGFPGLTFTNMAYPTSSPFSMVQHALMADGTIVFRTELGGAGATTLNNSATMTVKNGVFTMLMRKGDSVPGVSGLVFQSVGSSSVMNNNGAYAYEGILMNADGTSVTDPAVSASFMGLRNADGTILVLAKQFDAVPGVAGATFGPISGSSSVCISDSGVVVFANNFIVGGIPYSGVAILAWDAVNGLRTIAKTGDTNFTGTACNTLTMIGGTGVSGASTNTGINASGQLVLKAGDSVNSIYTIARINLAPVVACTADINGDHQVDGSDLAVVLSQWGTAGSGDINHDGNVDGQDLATLLGAWGTCP